LVWSLPSDRAGLLALATDYPYGAPPRSYLFHGGATRDLAAADQALFAGRRPVLAHGSNRSPAQLARKFLDACFGGAREGDAAAIPVTYGWLAGYDVVFAAHVARYGAVTSTLAAAPGVRARVAVTWLTPEQLAYMHETERMNYSYGDLDGGRFLPEAGPQPGRLAAYIGNHGALRLDGALVGMAAIAAEGRRYPALQQLEMQRRLAAAHHPGEDLETLLLARIADPAQRRRFEAKLRAGLQDAALEGFRLLARLDGET